MKHVVARQGQYVEYIVVLNKSEMVTHKGSVQFSFLSFEPFFISIKYIIHFISNIWHAYLEYSNNNLT
jgi:hypothetical protein